MGGAVQCRGWQDLGLAEAGNIETRITAGFSPAARPGARPSREGRTCSKMRQGLGRLKRLRGFGRGRPKVCLRHFDLEIGLCDTTMAHFNFELGHCCSTMRHFNSEIGHCDTTMGHFDFEIGHCDATMAHFDLEIGHCDTTMGHFHFEIGHCCAFLAVSDFEGWPREGEIACCNRRGRETQTPDTYWRHMIGPGKLFSR